MTHGCRHFPSLGREAAGLAPEETCFPQSPGGKRSRSPKEGAEVLPPYLPPPGAGSEAGGRCESLMARARRLPALERQPAPVQGNALLALEGALHDLFARDTAGSVIGHPAVM